MSDCVYVNDNLRCESYNLSNILVWRNINGSYVTNRFAVHQVRDRARDLGDPMN